MIDNVVYERSASECVKIGYLQQQEIQKNFQISSVRFPPPSKNSGYATVVPLYSNWKVGASASVCRVTLCILLGSFCDHCKNVWYNLFSGRPSKVLPWSWLKSLGLETRSLGLGLEVKSLGLDKKSLIYITGGHRVWPAAKRIPSLPFYRSPPPQSMQLHR